MNLNPGKNLAIRMEKARIALELGRYKPICEELKNVLREATPLAPLNVPVATFASEIREYARYTPSPSPTLVPGSYFQNSFVKIEIRRMETMLKAALAQCTDSASRARKRAGRAARRR